MLGGGGAEPSRTGDRDHDRLDRRVLLKAAAAGVIVWAAPVITSSPALAVATCTAKCLPTTPILQTASAVKSCEAGELFMRTDVTIPWTLSCPCGGTPVVSGTLAADPVEELVAASFNGSGIQYTTRWQVVVTEPQNFSRTATGSFSLSCTDRSGDACTRTCSMSSTVSYTHPPSTPCGSVVVVPPVVPTVNCS